MQTKLFNLANLILLAAFFGGMLICCSGCDLGTYNKRLNDRSPPKVEPAPETNGAGEGDGGGGAVDDPF